MELTAETSSGNYFSYFTENTFNLIIYSEGKLAIEKGTTIVCCVQKYRVETVAKTSYYNKDNFNEKLHGKEKVASSTPH